MPKFREVPVGALLANNNQCLRRCLCPMCRLPMKRLPVRHKEKQRCQ